VGLPQKVLPQSRFRRDEKKAPELVYSDANICSVIFTT